MLRVVAPGEGEVIGSAPDRRVDLLCDHDTLHATWTRFAAHRPGADPHVHRRHTDVFYVLAGELVLLLGPEGEPVTVPAGTLAWIPPLVVHGFRAGPGELRYLNLHAPGSGFADYLRALRDGREAAYDQEPPPERGTRPPGDAVIGGGEPVPGRPGATLLADTAELRIEDVRMDAAAPAPEETAPARGLRALYVLEGEVTAEAASGPVRAGAGTWLELPPGVPCAIAAADGGPARFLDVLAPGRDAAG